MSDLEVLLPLWERLRSENQDYVLVTVVAVEGSGYRKAGARMLIATDGRRAGTISGGCLEAEVAKKAFWHTQNGPCLRRLSTKPEDGDVPFGMGCGGVLHLLMERRGTAEPMLVRLAEAYEQRIAMVAVTSLKAGSLGHRRFWFEDSLESKDPENTAWLTTAEQAFHAERSFVIRGTAFTAEYPDFQEWVEWVEPRPGLFIFGAGDDAIPLVNLARQLGWYVTVADGRSHLATKGRFPSAHSVVVLPAGTMPDLDDRPSDAAALVTHSQEQDTRILRHVLDRDLIYLGVLGPRRRTKDMLTELAAELDSGLQEQGRRVEQWLDRLHAPMGLDLGAGSPAEIALSIVAEIQKERRKSTALPLRTLSGPIQQRPGLG